MVVLFHHQGKKQNAMHQATFLLMGTYLSTTLYFEIRGDTHISALTECWTYRNGQIKSTKQEVSKWGVANLNSLCKKILYLSKGGLPPSTGVKSMVMWGSVSLKNFIVKVLNLQIVLGDVDLSNLFFVDSDMNRFSTGE